MRDFLTARAFGAAPVLVGTAWTDQSDGAVNGVEPRAALAVGQALGRALLAMGPHTAVKVGMTGTAEVADAIARALGDFPGPVVFDPVLAASSGGSLFVAGAPADLLRLCRRATLVTPNLAEAAALTGRPVRTLADAHAAARALTDSGIAAVLVKGGHLGEEVPAVDVLRIGERDIEFSAARVPGPGLRGTGCALGTAIAVQLAAGARLPEATLAAKTWLRERLSCGAY